MTLVILCGFAGAVGGLTAQRLHDDFDREVADTAELIKARINYTAPVQGKTPGTYELDGLDPPLETYASNGAIVRIVSEDGLLFESTQRTRDFGAPNRRTMESDGYRVETRQV
ncbi:MAG: hypothetical protein ACRDMZ_24385, partial [Solirubrobacteraceae bacterium]